jgi:importin-5
VSSLVGDELKELTVILDGHLKKHFERSTERAEKRRDEDFDDETEEEMLEEDESDAYILNRLSDIIHSLLVTYADSYLPFFDTLVPHFYALLQDNRSVSDRQWALCVFDDVIQFTGAHSHRYSQFFLSRMADSLADASPEVESRRTGLDIPFISVVVLVRRRFDRRRPTGSA